MTKISIFPFALLTLTATLIRATAIPEAIPSPRPFRLNPLNVTTTHISTSHPTPTPPLSVPLGPGVDYFNACDIEQLTRANILAAIGFLIDLGDKPCVIHQKPVVLVTRGDVAITGYDGLAGGSTSTSCRDVGESARWIADNCVAGPLSFGGSTSANGNKGVIITVQRA
ncbi:hypothetical protein V492_07492 [Pseudogymnoascus sp. VKM F-4246]|nr:hypothetical protein V492_07492 [Pseudogymnoascus sp. VKM F-4246]